MGRSVSAGSQCGLASTQVIIWVSLMRRLPHQNSPCIPRPGFLHPATLRCVPCDPSLFAPCLLGGARTPQAKLTAPRRGGRKSQGTRHWAGVNRKCATPCRTHLCVPISHVCSWLARHSGLQTPRCSRTVRHPLVHCLMHVPKLFKASAASETDWLRAPHVVSHTCAVHPPVGNTEMRYQLRLWS